MSFLTVLYARIGSGVWSHHLACWLWYLFRFVSRPLVLRRNLVLSFCGPAILVCLIVMIDISHFSAASPACATASSFSTVDPEAPIAPIGASLPGIVNGLPPGNVINPPLENSM